MKTQHNSSRPIKKTLALLMTGAILVSMIGCAIASTGLSGKGTGTIAPGTQTEDVTESAPQEEIAERAPLHSSISGKDETVYVIADPAGVRKEVIVSDQLKNPEAKNKLNDISTLSEIENVGGFETYLPGSGDRITWEANGADIYYQGKTDKELPVDVKITYYLDGKKILPKDLAGKSGHVKIRFDYENKESAEVTIDGKERTIYVPFMAISGAILPNDHFNNVEIKNGKLTAEGKNTIAVGAAFPGLAESLDIEDIKEKTTSDKVRENLDKIEIPSYIEIEADATDFELSMTMTVISSDLWSDIDAVEDLDLTDLQEDMDDLQEGMNELIDGGKEFKDGTAELRDGTQELKDGVVELKDGTTELRDGTKELRDGAGELKDGTAELRDGVGKLKDGSGRLKDGAKTLSSGTGTLAKSSRLLDENVGKLQKGSTDLKGGLSLLRSQTSDLPGQLGESMNGVKEQIGGMVTDLTKLDMAIKQVAPKTDGEGSYQPGLLPSAEQLVGVASLLLNGEGGLQEMETDTQTLYTLLCEESDNIAVLQGKLQAEKAALTAMRPALAQAVENAKSAMASAQSDLDAAVSAAQKKGQSASAGMTLSQNASGAVTETVQPTTEETDPSEAKTATEEINDGAAASEQQTVEQTAEEGSNDRQAEEPSEEEGSSAEEGSAEHAAEQDTQAQGSEPEEPEIAGPAAQDTSGAGTEGTAESMRGLPAFLSLKGMTGASREAKSVDDALQAYQAAQSALVEAETKLSALDARIEQIDAVLAALPAAPGGSVEEDPILALSGKISQEATVNKNNAKTLYDGLKKLKAGIETIEESIAQALQGVGEKMQQMDKDLQEKLSGLQQLVQGVGQLDDGAGQLKNGLDQLKTEGTSELVKGTDKLNKGAKDLSKGTGELYDGVKKLMDGTIELDNGVQELKDGVALLDDGAVELDDGVQELLDGTIELDDGVKELDDGAQELLDGLVEMNEEGISKITEMFGDNLTEAVDRLKEIRAAGVTYNNFAGALEDENNSVKFIFRTEEIAKE